MSVERRARVAEEIRGILADAVRREVRDPRVGFVTVTAVELSPDLRQATVYVSALGEPADRDETLRALRRASTFLRRALASRARLRHTPDLRFVEDVSLERGSRVESLLGEIRRERADAGPDDEGRS